MRVWWVVVLCIFAACGETPVSTDDGTITLEPYTARVGGEHTYDLHPWSDSDTWIDYGSQSSDTLRVPRGEAILLEVRSQRFLTARVEGSTRSFPVRSGTTVLRLRAQLDGTLVFGDSVRVAVVAEPRDVHDRWLNEPPPPEYVACLGTMLWGSKGCAACHGYPEQRLVGGTLCGLMGRERVFESGERLTLTKTNVDDYVRESILDPRARIVVGYSPVMPRIQLTEHELASRGLRA